MVRDSVVGQVLYGSWSNMLYYVWQDLKKQIAV